MERLIQLLRGNRQPAETYSVRPFVGFFRWGPGIAKFFTIGTGIWAFWQNQSIWWITVPGTAAAYILYHYRTRIRCPQCRHPMRYCEVVQPNKSDRFQVHYDCSKCRITWNPNWAQTDASSSP